MIRAVLIAVALAAALPAFAQDVNVVASFSIAGDMVAEVGGDRIAVTTLVGPDADTHVFEPTPAHARALAEARLIFINGLAFEPWMDRLLKSTGTRAKPVSLTQGVTPLSRGAARGHDHGHGHRHQFDPHAWQNARNALTYVDNIRKALAAADPKNAAFYEARAQAYLAELRTLDAEIRSAFAKIPKKHRRVITTHDAFGYFAAAYGIEFIAPLGISTEGQASAKGVARLIDQIKKENIRAVFVENISDPRLIEQIARETGVKIGGKLYSDALSTKAGPAPTYIAMMRHNVRLLTAAMAPAL